MVAAVGFLGFLAAFLLLGLEVSAVVPARCSTDCLVGTGLAFCEKKDEVRFFVSGRAVDAMLFCESVRFCAEKGCGFDGLGCGDVWLGVRARFCFGALADSPPDDVEELSSATTGNNNWVLGRKILRYSLVNFSSGLSNGDIQERQTNHGHLRSSSEKMTVIASSAFLICCAFLCPCFCAKTKGKPHDAESSREINRGDSVPSFLGTKFPSERTSGSTLHLPTSPARRPASPLRVPASSSRFSSSSQSNKVGLFCLSFRQIARATQNFSPSNLIGGGGFCTVYRAHLQDGQVVAVKRETKEQDANMKSEFSNEVELLKKIEHRNLVGLLGYMEEGNERIIIMEYVPNGNLREHLDGRRMHILDFNERLEIAIDVAHALTYLHSYAEKQIIHRDIKSSNILLTEGFRAKVADFGFARTGLLGEDETHISTNVKGTAGYLDPEYLRTYRLTAKSDVFSYGILLIEIFSGRRPVELKRSMDERITVKWAFKKFEEGNTALILDPLLEEVVNEETLSKLFDLAFQCAAPTRSDRPSMKEVVEKLWEIRKEYSRNRKGK